MKGPQGMELLFPVVETAGYVLTRDALEFLAALDGRFDERRRALLTARQARQARFDAGERPDFPLDHPGLSDPDWRVGATPDDLLDRRVEITGPTDARMMINALNSGARIFMADLEDATSPTARAMLEGQVNLFRAVRGQLDYDDPRTGKTYRLGDDIAVLKVRPRGLHLEEAHCRIMGRPVSGALFDFALHFHHNAGALLDAGSGPYFYLPKLEHHEEARFWSDVFAFSEEWAGLPRGTIKLTVLIETLPAAFDAEAILYELRHNIVGLNCGRWDYIFSYIKILREDPKAVLPDRALVTMTSPFMRAYSLHVIRVCHRRGAHAMGGMAAQIPVKDDDAANAAAFEKVRADKEREATDGHDGTWVAHPALVPAAMAVFDRLMPEPHQRHVIPPGAASAAALLAAPEGAVTRAGLKMNIDVGISYIAAWISGRGAVPLHHLMEDAATAEISRAQLWQWRRHGARLEDGTIIDAALIDAGIEAFLAETKIRLGDAAFLAGHYPQAAGLMRELALGEELAPFLTTIAYDRYLKDRKDD